LSSDRLDISEEARIERENIWESSRFEERPFPECPSADQAKRITTPRQGHPQSERQSRQSNISSPDQKESEVPTANQAKEDRYAHPIRKHSELQNETISITTMLISPFHMDSLKT
jgi:hypothetical protein